MIYIKNADELKKMRTSGEILGEILQMLVEQSKEGISTFQLNTIAEEMMRRHKVTASFKGYHGYPASICTSINEEIVHGIPHPDRILKAGDLLKLDIGVVFKGMHSDAGRTVCIGEVTPFAARLEEITRQSFFQAFKKVRKGVFLNEIGRAVQTCAESAGLGVVRELVGHGVGRYLHEDPQIPNYYRPELTMPLKEGMTLAIEPMLNEGTWKMKTLSDGWTIITADRKLSAYYENTVVVTDGDPMILTYMPSEKR
ncbi:type I methionyl aminopeptidase [Candidatus Wirthbacteria bacterium CG2_30_54_11]|uniref:Methionine aminopeptidase n=1 Tax=Candidatus Wirthbacteria bacterium CG2_30_54_11 TaxID=1817892 RepID=A0A1J5IR42_9BACT|nr:MAG: type I methionyl aminopeptidase [Candidatus Wirthbacteria bacterium CG2_30_54_11]